jgi:hypothetical protein
MKNKIISSEIDRKSEIKDFLKNFVKPEIKIWSYVNEKGERLNESIRVRLPYSNDAWMVFVCDILNNTNEQILQGLKKEAEYQCLIGKYMFKYV